MGTFTCPCAKRSQSHKHAARKLANQRCRPLPPPPAQNELQLQKEKIRRKAAIVARQEEELAARDAAADEERQRARGLQRDLERATEDAGVREWEGSERIQVCERESAGTGGQGWRRGTEASSAAAANPCCFVLGIRCLQEVAPLLACAQRRCARRWGSCGGGWRTAGPRWPAMSR